MSSKTNSYYSSSSSVLACKQKSCMQQCIDFCIMMISCSPDDQQLVCVNVHIKTCTCSTLLLLLCNSLGTGPVSPGDANRGRFAEEPIPKHMLIDCHFLDCPANIFHSLDRCCCCCWRNPDPVLYVPTYGK